MRDYRLFLQDILTFGAVTAAEIPLRKGAKG